jgi:hypothetical protein
MDTEETPPPDATVRKAGRRARPAGRVAADALAHVGPEAVPDARADAAVAAAELAARRAVRPRLGVAEDPTAVRVASDAAVKHNTFPSRPGYPSGMAHWQTHLHVDAWVKNTAYAKTVWADVHVFGHDGALVHSETVPLAYERPAGDGGDIFRLDGVVFEGATATGGSAVPRPDVRLVQYRLYAEVGGRVVSDGRLHECVLRSDVASG